VGINPLPKEQVDRIGVRPIKEQEGQGAADRAALQGRLSF
jgi:hypothetical protein